MTGVALPSLKINQYPTAVQAIRKTKKVTMARAESLGIFNEESYVETRS